jgi:excisionase family DNA binding protein
VEQLLTTAEAADRLRTPEATLRYWRSIGKGPAGRKVGKRVLYSLADLEEFWDSLRKPE